MIASKSWNINQYVSKQRAEMTMFLLRDQILRDRDLQVDMDSITRQKRCNFDILYIYRYLYIYIYIYVCIYIYVYSYIYTDYNP